MRRGLMKHYIGWVHVHPDILVGMELGACWVNMDSVDCCILA